MKSLIKVFSILLIVSACYPSNKSEEVKDLLTKRDSLLLQQLKTQKENKRQVEFLSGTRAEKADMLVQKLVDAGVL